MVAWVWVNGVDRCGGMARWRSMWWVSRLARLAVVGFSIVVVSKIDSFFVFFFSPLGDYVVVVSCGCGCCWWFLKSSLCLFFLCGGSFLRLWLVVGGWSELWVCSDW